MEFAKISSLIQSSYEQISKSNWINSDCQEKSKWISDQDCYVSFSTDALTNENIGCNTTFNELPAFNEMIHEDFAVLQSDILHSIVRYVTNIKGSDRINVRDNLSEYDKATKLWENNECIPIYDTCESLVNENIHYEGHKIRYLDT